MDGGINNRWDKTGLLDKLEQLLWEMGWERVLAAKNMLGKSRAKNV